MNRIVFMGTPDFAVPSLEALITAGYEVAAVFTNPDRPKGRSGKPAFSPVKECALAHGIPVHQPQKLREPANIELLGDLKPDAIVVCAYGQIVPKQVLELPPYGCINVHGSLLPKYRGAAPIQWAVIDGEKESGVTIMQMAEGLDTGDMLAKCVRVLEPDETGGSLFDKLKEDGAALLVQTLQALERGEITPVKQPEESPTPYAKMLTKEMGRIDWSQSAVCLERLVRGMDPWPGTYTQLSGKQVKLWKTRVAESEALRGGAKPGTVVHVGKASFLVQTGDGLLEILELQLEGKKRMDTQAFLRGCHLEEGFVLGA